MTTTPKHKELDEYITKLNLAYSATFIPHSASRNAKGKHPQLNWAVAIGPNYGKDSIQRGLVTDYSQGIAHAPGYDHAWQQSGNQARYFAAVAEQGKVLKHLPKLSNGKVDWWECNERMGRQGWGHSWTVPLPAPLLRDVLYALVMDSAVLDFADFEEWASEYGYDKDSRAAEKTYNDCMKIALKLRSLIGNVALDGLREMFNDY